MGQRAANSGRPARWLITAQTGGSQSLLILISSILHVETNQSLGVIINWNNSPSYAKNIRHALVPSHGKSASFSTARNGFY